MKKFLTVVGTATLTLLMVHYADKDKLSREASAGWSGLCRIFKKGSDDIKDE